VRFSGLQDQAVPVTGAASGIGQAMAVAFAEQGAQVAINHVGRATDAAVTARLVDGHYENRWFLTEAIETALRELPPDHPLKAERGWKIINALCAGMNDALREEFSL
jgi:NAD(P)-dependent dehydrogenase (short-subunit alcohol dehydrogenase family)